MTSISVQVPATSANLGPGYDSFGLALGLNNRFSAEPAEEWAVELRGDKNLALGSWTDAFFDDVEFYAPEGSCVLRFNGRSPASI